MDAQTQYFSEMRLVKIRINQVEILLNEAQNRDRYIKMFLAITSTGSIASWAIWKDLAFFWGVLIAVSQFINAVKQYLPFSAKAKRLSGLLRDLETLLLFAEGKWFKVGDGQLTEEEIHGLQMEIKMRKKKSLDEFLPSTILPSKHKRFSQAEESADKYFSHFYGEAK